MMKRKKPTTPKVYLDPDQAYRISWRGTRLGIGCYRGFCSRCNAHMVETTEAKARCLTLVCGYCREEQATRELVAEIMEENARRSGVDSGPLEDVSGMQANAIRQLEDRT